MNAYDHFGDLPASLDEIEAMPGYELCHGCLRQVTPERWDAKECAHKNQRRLRRGAGPDRGRS